MTNPNTQPASDKQADLHAALDDGSLIHAAAKGSMEKRQAAVEQAELVDKLAPFIADGITAGELRAKADELLDWHNKQMLAMLDRLERASKDMVVRHKQPQLGGGSKLLGTSRYKQVPLSAIDNERKRLGGQK